MNTRSTRHANPREIVMINRNRLFLLSALLIAIGLGACAPTDYPKRTMGTLAGAAGGAFVGQMFGGGNGRLAATAGGALLGAMLGGGIGASLDRADILYMQRTQQRALESAPNGSTLYWRNPSSGNTGAVTPLRTYQVGPGRYCREFTTTASIGGARRQVQGSACRQADGSWRIQS